MLLHGDRVEKRVRQILGENRYLRKIRSIRGREIHGTGQKEQL